MAIMKIYQSGFNVPVNFPICFINQCKSGV